MGFSYLNKGDGDDAQEPHFKHAGADGSVLRLEVGSGKFCVVPLLFFPAVFFFSIVVV